MAYLAMSSYCQRIVNAGEDMVRAGMDPRRFVDLPDTLQCCRWDPKKANEKDAVAELFESAIVAMKPVATDDQGFGCLCEHAQIVWLRVGYVRALASRGGPFPRCQALDMPAPRRCSLCTLAQADKRQPATQNRDVRDKTL